MNGYRMMLLFASLFNQRAQKMTEGRKGLLPKIRTALSAEPRQRYWFHCASLGEFEQVRPLIEKIKKQKPELAVVLTFFSPSGYELRKNYALADYVFYLPLDSRSNAQVFIESVKPELVFFAKYDLWYFYLKQLKRQKIKTYLVSANFRPDQIYFRWYGPFFKEILHCFTFIFSQFESSTQLLKENGISHAITSGDTRYDRVSEIAHRAPADEKISRFKAEQLLGILGSSYDAEEQLTSSADLKGFKIIVAPHHIHESRLEEVEHNFREFKTVRYSSVSAEEVAAYDVLIIDNIGMLASAYRYADFALIGGGFGKGGIHNILEPLAHGVPVLFGPSNHNKYPETTETIQNGVGFTMQNPDELSAFTEQHLKKSGIRLEMKQKCKNFVLSRLGATDKVLENTGFGII